LATHLKISPATAGAAISAERTNRATRTCLRWARDGRGISVLLRRLGDWMYFSALSTQTRECNCRACACVQLAHVQRKGTSESPELCCVLRASARGDCAVKVNRHYTRFTAPVT